MKTGGVGPIGPRTSDARGETDATELSGPSPRRNALGLTSRGVITGASQNRNIMSSSRASLAGTLRRSLREAGRPQGEPSLRHLHSCLDREWFGAGVQF